MVRLSQLTNFPVLKSFTGEMLPHLFKQLDSTWCCKACKEGLTRNRCPSLAEVNGLAPTWLQLPELELEEHQALSNKKCPMYTLSNLAGLGGRESVLLVPTSVQPDSTNLQMMLDSVHCRTSQYVLRPQVMTDDCMISE